jgi:hypothetical protein
VNWEVERGSDGLYDVIIDGRVAHVALDHRQVEDLLEMHDIDDDEVEGDWP